VTATPSFLAFSTISKRFFAPTAEATISLFLDKTYQFQRHTCGCTLKACRHLVHCGQGTLYDLKVASDESFCCFRSQSVIKNVSMRDVPKASMAHP
jgi:hypothetical protein